MARRIPKPGSYIAPVVDRFPICIVPGFEPLDLDGDGVDRNWRRRPCPGYEAPYAPKSGGGFTAKRGRYWHRAWDIMAAEGAPIVAIADGAVVAETQLKRGAAPVPGVGFGRGGNWLCTIDSVGTEWYMAHLAFAPVVGPGQLIVAGQLLGYVGRTGNAHFKSGGGDKLGCPHLHLRGKDRNGVYFPPERHLLPPLKAEAWRWQKGWPEIPLYCKAPG